ncbi:MAG TPA: protocatechuate 3,4-dioxygenase subunit alpha [Bryobacteraceae bacterium]|nr:protocatechuate 3,4-dioxygenase subunit alpha [Bryobacteraceae bacterium]HUI81628.1 protocatechuate 3,4-dioxygenase subunit alpha [Bryobacteraceae bacterium]
MTPTPYGTIGPFFPGQFAEGCGDLTQIAGKTARGQHILLEGVVVEEGNVPVRNAVVEIWQPDANGVFRNPLDPRFAEADPGFFGWGRYRTDAQGRYRFRTVLPGRANGNGATRCPHVNLMVLAIGLTRRLVTTAFFSDTPEQIADPVLNCVTDPAQRRRLFAIRGDKPDSRGLPVYRFDLILRGENETPFFLD